MYTVIQSHSNRVTAAVTMFNTGIPMETIANCLRWSVESVKHYLRECTTKIGFLTERARNPRSYDDLIHAPNIILSVMSGVLSRLAPVMLQPSASRHVVSSSSLLSCHLLCFLLDRLSLFLSGLVGRLGWRGGIRFVPLESLLAAWLEHERLATLTSTPISHSSYR